MLKYAKGIRIYFLCGSVRKTSDARIAGTKRSAYVRLGFLLRVQCVIRALYVRTQPPHTFNTIVDSYFNIYRTIYIRYGIESARVKALSKFILIVYPQIQFKHGNYFQC